MTKITQAPASVVRAFLNDEAVWKTIISEDDEFQVEGDVRFDLTGVADTAMVTITGGDIYARDSGSRLDETLADVFNRYMSSDITVVVRTAETRQQELLDLLARHGFMGQLVSSNT